MAIVPKGDSAPDNVRAIGTGRGRPSGLGYDPATGKEHRPTGYVEKATRESTAETDVFTLVDERGYRPDRFYTRSLNADGHGERMQVRVPQGIDSQIYAAVATVPQYRSPHDFWRDAAVHRLEWIQKHYSVDDGMRRMLELERLTADGERRALEIETLSEVVVGIETKLQRAWTAEDWQMFAQEVSEANETIDWLREPYKTRLNTLIESWKQRGKEQLKVAKRQKD